MDPELSTLLRHNHTVRWTAPEVLNGARFSKEADIFSLAMVMIEVRHGLYIACGALTYCRRFTSMSGIHSRGSFQWVFTTHGHAFNNKRRAPPAAGTSRTHGKFVDVNATVLASWSPLAPGGSRSIANSSYTVSLIHSSDPWFDRVLGVVTLQPGNS